MKYNEIIETSLPDTWDLGGAWITDDGDVLLCEHEQNIHHSDLALEHFKDYIEPNDEGEYDDYSKDSAQDLAYENGWIRINTRGNRSISVEWRSNPTQVAKQSLLRYLTEDVTPYNTYEIEVNDYFKQYDDMHSLINAIRRKR